MLKIYHSNTLDTLRDVLVEMIKREPLSDPFLADQILVQSPGMAQWLKLELAQRIGVAANIEFPLPASFLWKVFVAALPDVPERSAYNKETMTWLLMRLLPRHLSDPRFAILKQYLKEDDNPLRLYHLAARVADLFDQYLVYRPDWIAHWEQGDNQPAETDQLWQPELWRMIVQDTSARSLPHWHRANMYDTFVQALSKAGRGLQGIPPRIFVFGISALPQNYLDALAALGNICEVHLMIANPCKHYWGDIVDPSYLAKLNRLWLSKGQASASEYYQTGHPLLASMGKLGRDYLHLIQEMALNEVAIFNEPGQDTLLHALQTDILELENRGLEGHQPTLCFSSTDKSVQLHANFSCLREVEVLHDQLLALFDERPELKPRDIIVMMPDVTRYAPYIDAVFGNAQAQHYLPYSISDRSADQEIPLINSFLQLINLSKSRFTASQVTELLELPATLSRYELHEEDFDNIRRWIHDVGIHWGINQQNRADIGSVAFSQNTWSFGIDRLYAGYSMGSEQQLWNGIAPYQGVAGLSAAALGRLSDFLTVLTECQRIFQGARSLSEWTQEIHNLLAAVYQESDPQDVEAVALINKALASLKDTFGESGFSDEIDVSILQDYLKEKLSVQRASQRFLSGQVNFCTLMPMRAIPFKVVCLLGMNDGEYPRAIPPMGFDLMVNHPKRGDRSRRDDDRYLFLEALLSAREVLYISYIGRSIADNTEKIPSVLVSEVLEYCDQAYRIDSAETAVSESIRIEHPLAAYSPRYFDGHDAALFSYNDRWLIPQKEEGHPVFNFVTGSLSAEALEQLELEDLLAFYRHPIKYFFEKRMLVYFRDHETVLSDEEPFSLHGLDDYLLRKTLLRKALNDEGLAQAAAFARQLGELPVGKAGDALLSTRVKDMQVLSEKMQPLMQGQAVRHEIRLACAGLTLVGWVDQIYENGVLRYDVSKVKGKHYFQTWIQHLVTCASGLGKPTTYRGLSEQFSFHPVEQALAVEYLTTLIDIYRKGTCYPLNWVPESAWAWLTHTAKDNDAAINKARDKFEAKMGGEVESPYVRRVYPEWKHIEAGVVGHTERLFMPMLDYMEVTKDER